MAVAERERLNMSDPESASPAPVPSVRPTASDMAFLGFLVGVIVTVAVAGTLTFREGLKTEVGKTQAEALVKWLADAKDRRAQTGFEPSACSSASPDPAKPPTWADCSKALFGPGGPMADLRNVFSGQPMVFLARCEPSDPQSPGQLALEKILSTPLGSAVSSITVALAAEDPIDKVLTIKVALCDKGGYPIKVAEVQF